MARKTTERKLSIVDAVSEAFGDIESLAEEMREAYDNTPESLQQSGVGERRGEAADNLESISAPDVPDSLSAFEVTLVRVQRTASQMRKLSRSDRRDDAVQTLDDVIQRLDELVETGSSQEIRDDAEGLRDELDNVKSEAEAVEFPGMFG